MPSGRRAPLEVLDDVGDEGRLAIDPGLRQRLVQEPAGRAHERLALEVLVIAGLLADEHPAGRDRALAEDGLRAWAHRSHARHRAAARAIASMSARPLMTDARTTVGRTSASAGATERDMLRACHLPRCGRSLSVAEPPLQSARRAKNERCVTRLDQ